jgi:para-nitrobenzyl esterase
MYRFDHFGFPLRMLGLGATHGSEIVHIQHSYASFVGRKLHPLGRRLQPPVGRRMQRAWLDFATKGWVDERSREEHVVDERSREEHVVGEIHWASGQDWPDYETGRRFTRIILSARDMVVEDPDAERRTVWEGLC